MHGDNTLSAPIGIFDSGVGGLSVWREILRQFPERDTLYVADQAHMPYGSRSLEEVRHYCEGVTRFLLAQGASVIVVACNSASAAALHHLRATFPTVPFVGMEPALKPAVQASRRGVVGVLATQATFQGKLFASLLSEHGQRVRVLPQVGWGLAQAVEAGALETPQTEALLAHSLQPLLEAGIDQLVLGCTHYPFLIPTIERMVGPGVSIVDPAPAVARQTGRLLPPTLGGGGHHRFYTSGDREAFAALRARLVPAPGDTTWIGAVRWCAGALRPEPML